MQVSSRRSDSHHCTAPIPEHYGAPVPPRHCLHPLQRRAAPTCPSAASACPSWSTTPPALSSHRSRPPSCPPVRTHGSHTPPPQPGSACPAAPSGPVRRVRPRVSVPRQPPRSATRCSPGHGVRPRGDHVRPRSVVSAPFGVAVPLHTLPVHRDRSGRFPAGAPVPHRCTASAPVRSSAAHLLRRFPAQASARSTSACVAHTWLPTDPVVSSLTSAPTRACLIVSHPPEPTTVSNIQPWPNHSNVAILLTYKAF
ncbi:hypothetical protein EV137_0148 [Kribbella pratensis]|uniref:Uncharacterized protein n=1 Tax=Kribbella pratensis TaxID=2512112 RepID=A0ABY2FIE7_9ACTN|nr:hypothetical protein EV137_0148 [Kribbella pratensis]